MPRWLFGIAGCLLILYALNVGLRIAAVKFSIIAWRVDDVGEFLLVLSGMAFFVAGLIAAEERRTEPAGGQGDSSPTSGGV